VTDHPSRSPYSSHSWEPRFVVEHHAAEPLRHAVELWRLCNSWFLPSAQIHYVAREPTRLQIAHPDSSRHMSAPWSALEQPIVAADVPALVLAWLETATYPEEPWFDGGEARGYCVYWAYYGSDDAAAYRSLVVLPKWFEIHK
jgi:hypothetical protein